MANEPHKHPCLFWDDNSGPVNVSLAYKDNTDTWQVNADIVTDAFQGQFINQHNQFVYMTDGEYGVVLIEDTSFDLELWQEGTTGWSADGTFTLTDDDTSENWTTVDVISLKNGFHALAEQDDPSIYGMDIFPDGAGNWIKTAGSILGSDYSCTYGRRLAAWLAGFDGGDSNYIITHDFLFDSNAATYAAVNTQVQIIVDDNNDSWIFSIDSPDLIVGLLPDPLTAVSVDMSTIHEEKIIDLTGPNEELLNYKASFRKKDNTLHVVSLEKIQNFPNWDYKLTYYRRDHNGWSTAMVVDSWSILISAVPDVAAQDLRSSAQITVDNDGNILLFNVEWDTVNSRGDLQVWELCFDDYDDYTTGGNWSQTTNLDGGTDDILGCSSLNIYP